MPHVETRATDTEMIHRTLNGPWNSSQNIHFSEGDAREACLNGLT